MTESQNEKDAGEVTGRTPWDIVSYVLNSFKENTSIFILFAVLVAAIYVLDDR